MLGPYFSDRVEMCLTLILKVVPITVCESGCAPNTLPRVIDASLADLVVLIALLRLFDKLRQVFGVEVIYHSNLIDL